MSHKNLMHGAPVPMYSKSLEKKKKKKKKKKTGVAGVFHRQVIGIAIVTIMII